MRWLIGAWLFCLIGYILTGCTKEKVYNTKIGDTYKVTTGFHKDCTGYAVQLSFENTSQQEVLLGGLRCSTRDSIIYAPDTWFKMYMVEKK